MTVTHIGEITIAAVIPGPYAVMLTAMADIQVKLQAMIDFSLQLGLPALEISVQLQLAADITASLNASIGLTPPSISAQLDITLAVIAQLRLLLQVYLDLFALLALSVQVYVYDGTVGAFGGELSSALASGMPGGGGAAAHCNALVIATEISATWSKLDAVFKLVA